jgi:hypothetical protein
LKIQKRRELQSSTLSKTNETEIGGSGSTQTLSQNGWLFKPELFIQKA